MTKVRWALVALVATVACGGRPHWEGDPEMFGVDLVVETDADWAHRDDFQPRLKRLMEMSVAYLGHDPAELDGLRLVIVDGVLKGRPEVAGTYSSSENTVTLRVMDFMHSSPWSGPCPEVLPVSHELLHYFIGDGEHQDPRWEQFHPLWEQVLAEHPECAGYWFPRW